MEFRVTVCPVYGRKDDFPFLISNFLFVINEKWKIWFVDLRTVWLSAHALDGNFLCGQHLVL